MKIGIESRILIEIGGRIQIIKELVRQMEEELAELDRLFGKVKVEPVQMKS